MMQAIPLAGRYRFLKRLSSGPTRTVWLAEDSESGAMVVAVKMTPRLGRMLDPVIGIRHPHLAALIDIVREPSRDELPDDRDDAPPGPIALAEWVSGQTLYDRLLQEPLPHLLAVQTIGYIASAVAALHERKAFHGAISARSVVMERADEGSEPVLSQVIMPADGSYASPERLAGEGPSPKDDVWALHVLLYVALTGQRPFRARTREALQQIVRNPSPVPLEAYGVEDAKLQGIVDRGFAKGSSLRTRSIFTLETELFRWLSAHADREPQPQRPEAGQKATPAEEPEAGSDVLEAATVLTPAPLQAALASMSVRDDGREVALDPPSDAGAPGGEPESAARPVAGEPLGTDSPQSPVRAPASRTRSRTSASPILRWLPVLLGALGLLAVFSAAGLGFLYVHAKGPAVPPPSDVATGAEMPTPLPGRASATAGMAPSPARSSAPHSSAASSVASSPPTGSGAAPSVVQDATECIASHFSPQTFARKQDLQFVCEMADPRAGSKRMRTKIVLGSGGKLTQGMQMWPRLGWHEMLVYGMLRRTCCPAGPGVDLPDPHGDCPPMGRTIDALSLAFAQGASGLGPHHEAFVRAATCAHRTRDRAYRYGTGPLSGGQLSYDAFVKRSASRPDDR